MKARDVLVTAHTQHQVAQLREAGFYHTIRLPDGRVLNGLQTEEQLRMRLNQFPIPEDLSGKRVIDIGTWDGWFAFEMERRGAEVVAVDVRQSPGFRIAHHEIGSKVEFVLDDVLNLYPSRFGRFDIALCLGVLYHVRHPLMMLEKLCSVCADMACIESYISAPDPLQPASMEFYETDELCGQFDNWVGPNLSCLLAMCRVAGFVDVRLGSIVDQRAHVTCFRRSSADARWKEPPRVLAVENSLSRGTQFRGWQDEFICVWFKCAEPASRMNTYCEVDGLGTPTATVISTGPDGWQANFFLPPGLADGEHQIQIAVANSRLSMAVSFWKGEREVVPPAGLADGMASGSVQIDALSDGRTWEQDVLTGTPERILSLWVTNLPHVEREAIQVCVGAVAHDVEFVSMPDEQGQRQINVFVSQELPPGDYDVSMSLGGQKSNSRRLRIVQ